MTRVRWRGNFPELRLLLGVKLILDNREVGTTIKVSPPIQSGSKWADSQGRVTASWLAAHFSLGAPSGKSAAESRFAPSQSANYD
jgi:hypothetical protein